MSGIGFKPFLSLRFELPGQTNYDTDYIQAAMKQATYRLLEDGSYFGEIPSFKDEVWSHDTTLADCQDGLRSVLEEWIVDQLYLHH